MAQAYKSPGVYRQEVLLRPAPALATGVPGFCGFADAPAGGAATASPVLLNRKEDWDAHFTARPESYLWDAVSAFFDNGGDRCYVARADLVTGSDGLLAAFASMTPLTDMDLLASPDIMTRRTFSNALDLDAIAALQDALLEQCEQLGNRMAILDSIPGSTPDEVLAQGAALARGRLEPVRGALYYPWLLTANGRMVPPCGHVAGIFALTDDKTGVYKAPANEEVLTALDLERPIDNSVQDQLNPAGINCLRAFPGRGIRVWGARTISSDANYRYVNVQRLFITLRRWIDMNMAWAAFEPNEPHLWVRIQRELTAYLSRLLAAGALKGATESQAFYVKCDAETNPPEVRDAGQVVVEIGLAPQAPAEFVVVRITWRTGQTSSD